MRLKSLIIGFTTASLLWLPAAPAIAAFQDGNALLADCTAERGSTTYYQRSAYCSAYIIGVFDDFMLNREIEGKGVCASSNITSGQVRDIVVKWMNDTPQMRHFSGATVVRMAIIASWPTCSMAK